MKKLKLFLIYFPILLVSAQVLVNGLYFLAPDVYNVTGFYLNTLFGTNVLFALFLVVFTFTLRYCAVSRYAAIAELMFAVNYLIVKEDSLYNILFQVIVGLTAISITIRYYTDKFPLCKMSLVVSFIKSIISQGGCKKGLEHWDNKIKDLLLKQHHERHS